MSTNIMVLLGTALKNLFKKPATVMFPAEHIPLPEHFRGEPIVNEQLCIACMRCEKVCPSGAIHLEKLEDKEFLFTLDVGRCTFCQECEDICTKDAIHLTDNWLLADGNKANLVRRYSVFKGGPKECDEQEASAS